MKAVAYPRRNKNLRRSVNRTPEIKIRRQLTNEDHRNKFCFLTCGSWTSLRPPEASRSQPRRTGPSGGESGTGAGRPEHLRNYLETNEQSVSQPASQSASQSVSQPVSRRDEPSPLTRVVVQLQLALAAQAEDDAVGQRRRGRRIHHALRRLVHRHRVRRRHHAG